MSALQRGFTNNLATQQVGQVRYGAFVDADGVLLDEGTIYRRADGSYYAFTNTDTFDEYVREHSPDADVTIVNLLHEMPLVSVQGPRSREILQSLSDFDFTSLPYFRFAEPVTVAGIRRLPVTYRVLRRARLRADPCARRRRAAVARTGRSRRPPGRVQRDRHRAHRGRAHRLRVRVRARPADAVRPRHGPDGQLRPRDRLRREGCTAAGRRRTATSPEDPETRGGRAAGGGLGRQQGRRGGRHADQPDEQPALRRHRARDDRVDVPPTTTPSSASPGQPRPWPTCRSSTRRRQAPRLRSRASTQRHPEPGNAGAQGPEHLVDESVLVGGIELGAVPDEGVPLAQLPADRRGSRRCPR